MKHSMIKLVDAIVLIIVVLSIIASFIIGFAAGPVQGLLMGLAALVGASFASALWFCVSGIYHNTRRLADLLEAEVKVTNAQEGQ